MDPKHISRKQQSEEGRTELALYCIKDTELPLQIYDATARVPTLVENAAQIGLQTQHVLDRGVQSWVFSKLLRKGKCGSGPHFLYYVFPYDPQRFSANASSRKENYEGGKVMDPISGYYEDPTAVLDFSSLYPSIMQAHNLCPSTLVDQETIRRNGFVRGRDVHNVHKGGEFWFLDTRIRHGLLPQLLDDLLGARARTKRAMKREKDPWRRAMLNARQLSIKVVANSTYGFMGAEMGILPCKPVAATVTARGREMIMTTKDAIEKRFQRSKGWVCDSQVVYGDSVSGDTPIIVRDTNTGCVFVSRIDEFVTSSSTWIAYGSCGKEQVLIDGIEVWQDGGFTPITRIIRHARGTHQKLVRVLTHTGLVDCTEDHSLLRPNGDCARPRDVDVGTKLLHTSDDSMLISSFESNDCGNIGENEAFAMGLFVADGSCGVYGRGKDIKHTWCINNADHALLERAARCLTFKTKILETMHSSGVYKLIPVGNHVDPTLRYRALFYNAHREKRIPPIILHAPLTIVRSFFDGMYAGDGDRQERMRQKICRIDQKGKEICTGLWILGRRLGWKVSINDRVDKPAVFRLTFSTSSKGFRRAPTKIKKMRLLETSPDTQYVYDLETSSHHFHVGPGNLVVHNTDSVMVRMYNPVPRLPMTTQTAVVLGHIMAKYATTMFPAPNELEMEKIFERWILLTKKRYVACAVEGTPISDLQPVLDECANALIQERDDGGGEVKIPEIDAWSSGANLGKASLTVKGVACVRRDAPALVVRIMNHVIDLVLMQGKPEEAIEYSKQELRRTKLGEVPLEELIVSKQLSKPVEDYVARAPHVCLAERMAIRQRGGDMLEAPIAGDRVPYIIVYTPPVAVKGKPKVGDMAEHPEYAKRMGLRPNGSWYVDHQLRNPLKQIMDPVVQSMGEDRDVEELFTGDHMRSVRIRDSLEQLKANEHAKGKSKSAWRGFWCMQKCPKCKAVMTGDKCTYCTADTPSSKPRKQTKRKRKRKEHDLMECGKFVRMASCKKCKAPITDANANGECVACSKN
jgi:DNA polymerase elongation subunit (family B)